MNDWEASKLEYDARTPAFRKQRGNDEQKMEMTPENFNESKIPHNNSQKIKNECVDVLKIRFQKDA
jgi:hypothetical protein